MGGAVGEHLWSGGAEAAEAAEGAAQRLAAGVEAITAEQDPAAVLQRLLEALVPAVGAPRAVLDLTGSAVGPAVSPAADPAGPALTTDRQAVLRLPIAAGADVLGHVVLRWPADRADQAHPTPREVAAARVLAAAAGAALAGARLRQEAELHRRWQDAATGIRTRLLTGSSPTEVLDHLAGTVLPLVDARAAFVVLGPDEGGLFEVSSQAGAGLEDLRGKRVTGPVLAVLDRAVDAVEVDITDVPYRGPNDHVPWGPGLAVPLQLSGTERGALLVMRAAGAAPFGQHRAEVVAGLADQVAVALQAAARSHDDRRLAVYEDRERIARGLHDHVVQRLFAAGLSLQGALGRDDGELRRRAAAVVEHLDDTVLDVCTTIFALQDTGTASGVRRRLLAAVQEHTAGTSKAVLRVNGPADTLVDGQLADDLVAVAREGVSNAVRHGGAEHVVVTVDVGDRVVVAVDDDGCGIGPDVARSGLAGLAARADRRGGDFSVSRGEGGGTSLRWSAPLTA